jgi:predicted dehydrogenase
MNVAVVGIGFIGPVHIEALRRAGVTVRGILGQSAEETRKAAAALNVPVAYDSYDDLLRDPDIHAVHLATPNRLHYPMTSAALEAGKHVMCEKPLAMNTAESAALVQLAQSRPAQAAGVNYNMRFYPLMHHARDMVQSGALGEIYSVRGAYFQDWLLYDTDWNWRLRAEEGGALRAVGDIGTHWLDLITFITGLEIAQLVADLATLIPTRKRPRRAVATFKGKEQAGPVEYDSVPIDTEDWGSVMLRFQGGARGSMNVSQTAAGRKNRLDFEISGAKASIAWDSERPNELWIGHRDAPNELLIKDPSLMSEGAAAIASMPGGHAEGFPDSFKQLYRTFYGYIEAGDFSAPRPFPTFEEGHHELVLCERILQSQREGRWVDVEGRRK